MIVAPEGWDGDGSRGGCGGAGAVELAEDVEGGDESDEAQRHDEHHGWREAQARGLVGVEPKHVAPAAAGEAPSPGASGGAAAAHAGGSYFWLMICSLGCSRQSSQSGNQIPFINSANPVMSLVSHYTLFV